LEETLLCPDWLRYPKPKLKLGFFFLLLWFTGGREELIIWSAQHSIVEDYHKKVIFELSEITEYPFNPEHKQISAI